MIPRLKEQYKKTIILDLKKKLSMENDNQVPKFAKVVLNMGLGLDGTDKKKLQNCVEDMSLISGQKPLVTRFKKSISNFKSRKGTEAGLKVTLRSNRMFQFVDRLVNIALPRIKDFRGLSDNGCDKFGNYSFGIKEHIIFPEINFDKVDRIRGMDITIVTDSNSPTDTIFLLKEFNFPIVQGPKKKGKKIKTATKEEERKEEKKNNG